MFFTLSIEQKNKSTVLAGMVTIRQATIDDIPLIMKFIDEYWRRGDPLALDRVFFEWSFLRNGKVTIILGIDDEIDKIYGIQGYMPYTDDETPDCAGAIWKAIRCEEDPLLGIHLADYMHTNIPMRFYAGAGMRKPAIRFAKLNGGVVEVMDHYYRLNSKYKIQDYSIAKIRELIIPKVQDYGVELERLHSITEFKGAFSEKKLYESVFRKDYKYIEKRYYNHPQYNYDVWLIKGDICKTESVIVTRAENYLTSSICKIVDFFGDELNFSYIGKSIDRLLEEQGHEFVDIYTYGFNVEYIRAAGFVECTSDSENIIPNHFQPFEQKNIDIMLERPWFDGLVLFRGDGDQDRPCCMMK